MVFAEGMDAVDVSIAATTTPAPGQNIRAAMTDRFTTKLRKYQQFASLTTYRVVPFVMSVYGLVCGETREMILGWRRSANDPKNPAPGENIRDVLQERFMQKVRKYEKFAEKTDYRVVPFVLSIYGLVCKSTRDLLGSWKAVAQDFSFIYDLYNNVQMSLIRAQHEMVKFVENKSKLMEAKKRWEGTVR